MTTSLDTRKTKTLHSVRANRQPAKPVPKPERNPLHPVQVSASKHGTVDIKLPLLGRFRSKGTNVLSKESITLTETGLKQIKSMVVRNPVRCVGGKVKDKLVKLAAEGAEGSITPLEQLDREIKTDAQLTELQSVSGDTGLDRQPVCVQSGDTNTRALSDVLAQHKDDSSFGKDASDKFNFAKKIQKLKPSVKAKSQDYKNNPVRNQIV